MTKHFRAPIFDTFRKSSPFEGLWAHAEKVAECTVALEATLESFLAADQAGTRACSERVSALELEADMIKSNIRNHLPGNVRMAVSKPLFLAALSEQDDILDEAEDAAIWMSMRVEPVSEEIATGLRTLLAKVVETVDAYEEAVRNIRDLLETGFIRREREQEKALIHRVHELEHETDVIGRGISESLLSPRTEKQIGGVRVYHLLKLVLQISKIADHAENAGDRLRAMMSR